MRSGGHGKIQIEKVSKTFYKAGAQKGEYQAVEALRDVNLDVKPDEFISFIGPSGCGKTTCLRLIDGLSRPDSGVIAIDGRPVEGPGPDRGFVFQTFGLFPWRTVLANVEFGLEVRGEGADRRKEQALKYIDMVGLSKFKSHYPHELSGGMQQRVGLARALAIEPEILLMDEPFGSVDAQTREILQEELQRIWHRTAKTIVFVTHSIDEAIFLSDRIALFSAGPGTIHEILEVALPRPRWEYNVRAEKAFSELRGYVWEQLRGRQDDINRMGGRQFD